MEELAAKEETLVRNNPAMAAMVDQALSRNTKVFSHYVHNEKTKSLALSPPLSTQNKGSHFVTSMEAAPV